MSVHRYNGPDHGNAILLEAADAVHRGEAWVVEANQEFGRAYSEHFGEMGDIFRTRAREQDIQTTLKVRSVRLLKPVTGNRLERQVVSLSRQLLTALEPKLAGASDEEFAERMCMWWADRAKEASK